MTSSECESLHVLLQQHSRAPLVDDEAVERVGTTPIISFEILVRYQRQS